LEIGFKSYVCAQSMMASIDSLFVFRSIICKIGLDLKLDILDTGGSYVFPAMRTLAIKSADGFVLVCAVDDPTSLEVSLKQ
jgi:GTPase SAR1 family protein